MLFTHKETHANIKPSKSLAYYKMGDKLLKIQFDRSYIDFLLPIAREKAFQDNHRHANILLSIKVELFDKSLVL